MGRIAVRIRSVFTILSRRKPTRILRPQTGSEQLRRAGRTAKDLAKEKKSAEWKVALAAAMKRESNATNRWLGEHMNMGSLHDVSRRVSAYQRGTINAKT